MFQKSSATWRACARFIVMFMLCFSMFYLLFRIPPKPRNHWLRVVALREMLLMVV